MTTAALREVTLVLRERTCHLLALCCGDGRRASVRLEALFLLPRGWTPGYEAAAWSRGRSSPRLDDDLSLGLAVSARS